MDFERLEQHVLRRPLQELEFRNETGVYVPGNFHTKPAWWYVCFKSTRQHSQLRYEGRGLKDVVKRIEQVYPDFYSWLFCTFTK